MRCFLALQTRYPRFQDGTYSPEAPQEKRGSQQNPRTREVLTRPPGRTRVQTEAGSKGLRYFGLGVLGLG